MGLDLDADALFNNLFLPAALLLLPARNVFEALAPGNILRTDSARKKQKYADSPRRVPLVACNQCCIKHGLQASRATP
jgi:hypothetical protein